VLELNEKAAPITVKNFESYVSKGFFNDTIFHRVIDGFMIQGGGFTKEMSQKQTDAPIKNEADNGLKMKSIVSQWQEHRIQTQPHRNFLLM